MSEATKNQRFLKEFKKWFDKECDEGKTIYPSSYYDCSEGWIAAMKCVRDKMLPSCYEPTDIYDLIEEELDEN